MESYAFVVGTFNTPSLYTLAFVPPSDSSKASLKILQRHDAIGSHSWLALSPSKQNLYATCWTEPPTVAAYKINSATDIKLQNSALTKSRSGYVCASSTHVYSAGGATGEVFSLDRITGSFVPPRTANSNAQPASTVDPVQHIDFVSDQPQQDDGSTMDFGGLRHGAHSADLSPDGRYLYVADIGRNCIWVFAVAQSSVSPSSTTIEKRHLTLVEKHISPRAHDGPRHVWPHPNGKVVYTLQEHSSMVDVFRVDPTNGGLEHVQGVRIIPSGLPVSEFWADEVRTSFSSPTGRPRYLYASTRGLKAGRKGYVATFALRDDGLIDGATETRHGSDEAKQDQDQGGLIHMFETATSGGWANAVQPGPTLHGTEYIAMTDSEEGLVFVLAWDGKTMQEAARIDLNQDKGSGVQDNVIVGAATAIWLEDSLTNGSVS